MFTYKLQTNIQTVKTVSSISFLMGRDAIQISNAGLLSSAPLYRGETRSGRVVTVDHEGEVVMTSHDRSTVFLADLVRCLQGHFEWREKVHTYSPEDGEGATWTGQIIRESRLKWAREIVAQEEDIAQEIALQEAKPKGELPPKRRPKKEVVVK
jgi:hypothetical protein